MPKREAHWPIVLTGGPEDGHVKLGSATLDVVVVTTRHDGKPLHEYTYARTNRFERSRRVYELVSVLSARGRSRSEQ